MDLLFIFSVLSLLLEVEALVALLEEAELLFHLIVLAVEALLSLLEGLSLLLIFLLPKIFLGMYPVDVGLRFLLELGSNRRDPLVM